MKEFQAKMQIINNLIILLLTSLFIGFSSGTHEMGPPAGEADQVGVAFYNVENFFDTIDSKLDDDEFLPSSLRKWNTYKYYKKLNNFFKAVSMCNNGMEPPAITGLCEIENANVLEDICTKSLLKYDNYSFIISEGLDERGISTAMLYRPDVLTLLNYESWIPPGIHSDSMKTRALLYGSFRFRSDTLHVVICHWPSRRGGTLSSEKRRIKVATFLKNKLDSLPVYSKILIMGDFNDEPNSLSLKIITKAVHDDKTGNEFVNVSKSESGSYKYQGTWYLFDQILISDELLNTKKGLKYRKESYKVIRNKFLLTSDLKYKGQRPASNWWGYKYQGAFSDHLPVVAILDAN